MESCNISKGTKIHCESNIRQRATGKINWPVGLNLSSAGSFSIEPTRKIYLKKIFIGIKRRMKCK